MLFNLGLEVPARTVRQNEKKKKIRKEEVKLSLLSDR